MRKIIDFIKNIFLINGPDDLALKHIMAETEVSSDDIIRSCIEKYTSQYISVLSLISFFEVVMIIRGCIYFDFSSVRRILYMVCYGMLLTFSVLGISVMSGSKKKKVVTKSDAYIVYAYCIFLTIWSAMISILDIFGGHTPVVFMTVIMGTAALAFINPKVFISLVAVLSGIVVYFSKIYGDHQVSSEGNIINLVVFVVFTFLISARLFNQNKADYIVMTKLESLSYHDQLTGLKNRYALQNDLAKSPGMIYFGIFDFDNFKAINDQYGHDFGDECLSKVAHLLASNFNDNAYRYGGDEFVIVTTMVQGEIVERCENINKELKEIYPDINVQVSGGFYFPKTKNEGFLEFLKYSDQALYEAKQNKGTFVFYD